MIPSKEFKKWVGPAARQVNPPPPLLAGPVLLPISLKGEGGDLRRRLAAATTTASEANHQPAERKRPGGGGGGGGVGEGGQEVPKKLHLPNGLGMRCGWGVGCLVASCGARLRLGTPYGVQGRRYDVNSWFITIKPAKKLHTQA